MATPEPWAAGAAPGGRGPGSALGAPTPPTRLTLGVSGPAQASLSPTVGVRIRRIPARPEGPQKIRLWADAELEGAAAGSVAWVFPAEIDMRI